LCSQLKLIPLKGLREERFGRIICYPKCDSEELEERLKELKQIDVQAVEFSGPKTAHDTHVLGKGCVSIVLIAHTKHGLAALKARRIDASRIDMEHEVAMLKKANSVGVGPSFYGSTKNFILMELVEGTLLPEWISSLKGRGKAQRIRRVLRRILEDCWQLDRAELDHGELSRAAKHIIIEKDDTPRMVDFEAASTNRRPANVTSIVQYLLIGSDLAKKINHIIGRVSRERLIEALGAYKRKPNLESFSKILTICKLGP